MHIFAKFTPSKLASHQETLGSLAKANKSVYFGYWSPPLINQLYSQTVGGGIANSPSVQIAVISGT